MKNVKPPLITRPQHQTKVASSAPTEVLPYLSKEEMKLFNNLRKQGKLTFFGVKACRCGKAMPKSRDFCSRECWKEVTDVPAES